MNPGPSCRRSFAAMVALLCVVPWLAQAQQSQQQPAGLSALAAAAATPDTAQAQLDVALEAALAIPMGDLPASFAHTERGFGAKPGYSLGLRLRWFVASGVAISPTFHFTAFGDHEDYDAAGNLFFVAATAAHFGVDLLYQAPGAFADWRPFVAGGVEITQNRFRESFDTTATEYKASVTGLSPRLQIGVRRGDFCGALAWQWSRFATPRFFDTGEDTDYNWDTARFVIGYTLPRL